MTGQHDSESAPSAPAPLAVSGEFRGDRIIRFIAFGLLLAATLHLPGAPGIRLDDSWQLVLAHGLIHHLRFGVDLIFTFGPLGALENSVQLPSLFWIQIAWQLISRGAIVLLLARMTQRLSLPGTLLMCAQLAICSSSADGVPSADVLPMIATWAAGAILVLRRHRSLTPCALAAFVLAILSLVKFSVAVASLIVIGLAVSYLVACRFRRLATIAALLYPAVFILGWTLCGQPIASVRSYFTTSTEMAKGYAGAMVIPSAPLQAWITAVALLACLLIPLGLVARHRTTSSDRRLLALITAALAAISFRHGTIRLDVYHASTFFAWISIVAFFWHLLLREEANVMLSRIRRFLAAVAALAFVLIWAWPPHQFGAWKNVRHALSTMKFEARLLSSPRRTHDEWHQRFTTASQRFALAPLEDEIGSAAVDVGGFQQGIVILNQLRYSPRPIPQGYAVYTSALADRNGRWMEETRPRVTLARLETIDDRIPTLDDSRSLLWLLRNDRVVAEAQGFLVLRPKEFLTDIPTVRQQVKTTLRLGDWLMLDQGTAARIQEITIDASPTTIGFWLQTFYPCPALRVQFRFTDGTIETYTAPAAMARAGFVSEPFLHDTDELRTWLTGGRLKRVAALRVVPNGRVPVYRGTAQISVVSW